MDKESILNKLHNLLLPVLTSKEKEFITLGRVYITKEDIWSYFKDNVWCNKDNLRLCDLVSDILLTSNDEIDEYLLNKKIKEKDWLLDEKRNYNLWRIKREFNLYKR